MEFICFENKIVFLWNLDCDAAKRNLFLDPVACKAEKVV